MLVPWRSLNRNQGKTVTEYAPIAKVLSFLDAVTEQRLKKKLNIAYFICKERLAFSKNWSTVGITGVDVGFNYTNRQSCTTFV